MHALNLKHTIELAFQEFPGQKPVGKSISGVVYHPDGSLWLASDEAASIEKLERLDDHHYGQHQRFALGDLLELPGRVGDEIDIEGLAFEEPYLWLVGSHAKRFRKTKGGIDARVEKIVASPQRYLIARIPIENGLPVRRNSAGQTAACVKFTKTGNRLTDSLQGDEYIGPFLQLPAKANGLDVEGLAVRGEKLYLGLRGPVLDSQAIILEIETYTSPTRANRLRLKPLDAAGRRYRKHFVDLRGLGVRDLCWNGDDLLVLAGPTLGVSQPMKLFVVPEGTFPCELSLEIAQFPGSDYEDHAEGICRYPGLGGNNLLAVYDSPSDQRQPRPGAVRADVFGLA